LEVCADNAEREPSAAVALERWAVLLRVSDERPGSREERFRRRAYERQRDVALIALALRGDIRKRVRPARRRSRRAGKPAARRLPHAA
jgi:hypothetical protein